MSPQQVERRRQDNLALILQEVLTAIERLRGSRQGVTDAQALRPDDSSDLSTTALADLERMTILRVFEQAGGDKVLAGKMLGISRATLYRKLKRYNIPLRAAQSAQKEAGELVAAAS